MNADVRLAEMTTRAANAEALLINAIELIQRLNHNRATPISRRFGELMQSEELTTEAAAFIVTARRMLARANR